MVGYTEVAEQERAARVNLKSVLLKLADLGHSVVSSIRSQVLRIQVLRIRYALFSSNCSALRRGDSLCGERGRPR
jgi:hypothetical protein